MANIRPPVPPAQTGPRAPLGPHGDPDLDGELDRFERRLRYEREHPLFGVHPDGLGPTLGQDLTRPNPGRDLDWDHQGFDPES